MPLAVTSYDFSVFLHVTAVVVGFGATFAESITFRVAMMVDKRHLPYVHRLQRAINQWLASPALLVILATGFYQVSDHDWDLGDFWLSGTLTIVIVLSAILGGYFIPEDRRLQAMAERDIAASVVPPVVPPAPARSCSPTSTSDGRATRGSWAPSRASCSSPRSS